MGLFSNLMRKKETTVVEPVDVLAEAGKVYLPVSGEVIALAEMEDPVFSSGIMGKGLAIRPSGEVCYAPADGTIALVADTGHSVAITTDDGMEILIHIGIDTVAMNGEGFKVLVRTGDQVKAGQPLIQFSISAIHKAGYKTTTALLIANTNDFSEIEVLGKGNNDAGKEVLSVKK